MKAALYSIILAAAMANATAATAGSVFLPGVGSPLQVDVQSYRERRFATVVRQAYDFSCGSAAVATLLTFHYNDERTEQEVFLSMFEAGDQDEIRAKGFSLLDMKRFLEGEGYRADGFRITLDDLAKAAVPAIALIDVNGYSHFVVVKGIKDGNVLVGNPALGSRALKRKQFEAMWNGVLFLIHNKADIARQQFNHDTEWAYLPRYPLGNALGRTTLSEFTRSLPSRHGDFR